MTQICKNDDDDEINIVKMTSLLVVSDKHENDENPEDYHDASDDDDDYNLAE